MHPMLGGSTTPIFIPIQEYGQVLLLLIFASLYSSYIIDILLQPNLNLWKAFDQFDGCLMKTSTFIWV